ncbi:MAG: M28 family peptidase, partial [Holophagaceae bacterium]
MKQGLGFLIFTLGSLLVAQQPHFAINPKVLQTHVEFLSDDLLEGRGTGERGGELTVRYLETQSKLIGLQPFNGTSYRQSVKIAGLKTLPTSTLSFEGQSSWIPSFGSDIVYGTGTTKEAIDMDAPMVFVGYGITAPEEQWDDYKGLNYQGKVVVMMVNDPQPTPAEPSRFGGASLTYYGRWTYKFEEARRRGAAGVLLIHTTPSASYGWSVVENGWRKERSQLATGAGGTDLQGWISNETAQKLFAMSGLNLDQERAKAEKRSFKPVPLSVKVKSSLKSQVRLFEQFNVGGLIPGTDPQLSSEAVVYSAHWDHLGKNDELIKQGKDGIYNGAVDNASGTASLLAMAQVAMAHPTKRTQMFLWVCAEEQGLLGSAHYAQNPLWSLDKTAANLNLDSTNYLGPTRDIGSRGSERSSLGQMVEQVAQSMNMVITPSRPDIAGGY